MHVFCTNLFLYHKVPGPSSLAVPGPSSTRCFSQCIALSAWPPGVPECIAGLLATVKQTFRAGYASGGHGVLAPWHCTVMFHHTNHILRTSRSSSAKLSLQVCRWLFREPPGQAPLLAPLSMKVAYPPHTEASSPAYLTLRTLFAFSHLVVYTSYLAHLGLRASAAGGSPGPPRRLRIQWLGRTVDKGWPGNNG